MTPIVVLDPERIRDLVLSTQAGDRLAFGELYEAFEGHILAISVRRLRNYAEAQELCQDVFIQALCKISQLRVAECFGPWLCAIARRMAVNRLARRRIPAYAAPELLEGAPLEHMTPLALALAAECGQQVRDGLERLGNLDRETLVAFYVEGRSLAEMSDEFAAPLGTIKRRLHVARKRLAKQMESLVAV